jgi:putative intracellular protease/amidase
MANEESEVSRGANWLTAIASLCVGAVVLAAAGLARANTATSAHKERRQECLRH